MKTTKDANMFYLFYWN